MDKQLIESIDEKFEDRKFQARILSLIFDVLCGVKNITSKGHLDLTKDFELLKSVYRQVYDHYYDYCMEYGVEVTDVDTYKIISWSSYICARELFNDEKRINKFRKAHILITTGIFMSEECLKKDKQIIIDDKRHKDKIISMLEEELRVESKNNDSDKSNKCNGAPLGLGMNGMYMIFKTLSLSNIETM